MKQTIVSSGLPEHELHAETWRMTELTLESETAYADPFSDVAVDLILTGCGKRFTVPGFWDGGNTFRVRFVCPSAGKWTYHTVCSDRRNRSLHGRTGEIDCKPYTGPLDVYRRGFVTTRFKKRWFTYDDGAPFFYLGDTHWSLGEETADMVRRICEKRVSQGFTVWQSEPIGAQFDLAAGVTETDIAGLRAYDEKFRLIADAGLVHANAEFFFPSQMDALILAHGGYEAKETPGSVAGKPVSVHALSEAAKIYLERLSRYWVARYGAFPVFWTLGQEVDDDFYWNETSSRKWNAANNPYKEIASFIKKYDAYAHPLTAHQENAALVGAYGGGQGLSEKRRVYSSALPSAFRDVSAHTFYAAQWSPPPDQRCDHRIPRDFWHNGQKKPVVNYEGRYCYLWTKNFGSRMQGWAAFLSGMYGYGWGAQDTWSYLNPYDETNDTSDGVDTVTAAEKAAATWVDALEYPSGYQVGFMRRFLEETQWYDLIPRFDNRAYFRSAPGVYAYCAGNRRNTEIVLYFYSFTDPAVAERANTSGAGGTATGAVGRLEPGAVYTYRWFDPVSGEYLAEGTFCASADGCREIGARPKASDMALLICKKEREKESGE